MRDNEITALRNAFPYLNDGPIRSINEKADYYWVVENPAYKDFTPRTVAGSQKAKVSAALRELADTIYDYIHNDESDYELWHRSICDNFIENYRSQSGISIKYGKAQKIVNMTMKYLYCFPDSAVYASKFTKCHMPLDSYTLNWFCDVVVPIFNQGKKRKDKISVTKIHDNSWSKLDCGTINEKYTYLWLQDQIRNYLYSSNNCKYRNNDNNALTPFEAEFYIWPEQQFNQAIASILSQGVYSTVFPSYQDVDLLEKCNSAIDKLNEYKRKLM